ncbi:MAG: NADPH-dependent FMN reductase [Bacteroidota bacterium]
MITIISSTNRKNSNSSKVAAIYLQKLKEKGVEAQVLNLEHLPHDFAYTQIEDVFSEEFDKVVQQYIISVEKFIFIIPEYNGGYPGILKTFIDSVHPKHFRGKKSALAGISAGRAGALKGMDDFTGILHYLQVEVLSDKPKISDIEKFIDENGQLTSAEAHTRMEKQLEKFLRF